MFNLVNMKHHYFFLKKKKKKKLYNKHTYIYLDYRFVSINVNKYLVIHIILKIGCFIFNLANLYIHATT